MSAKLVKRKERVGDAWVLVGGLLLAHAGHWFITPMRHVGAPLWRMLIVAGQALVGVGLLAYVARLRFRERAVDRELEAGEHRSSLRGPTLPID